MASFKDIKRQFTKEQSTPEPKTLESTNEKSINTAFEYEEARYLLKVIADNDFKGRDIQLVYDIALKLQTIIKNQNN